MIRTILLGAVLVLAALACDDEEPTELVVLVNSDYKPGTELAHVDVAITTDRDAVKQSWDIVSRAPRTDDEAKLPFSFAIKPPGGDAGARVDFTVSGLDPDKHTLVRRRVRVGFVAHQLRLLEIDLTHDCADRFERCEQDGNASAPMTCVAGKCVGIDVNVDDLRRIHPGDEVADAKPLPPWHCTRGCMDAGGIDAGADASPSEGGSGVSGGGGSGGRHAVTESGGNGGKGGNGGHPLGGHGGTPDPGGNGGDSGDDPDDGINPPSSCSERSGLFADVGRPLAETADHTLCVTVAQNRLAEQATADASTTELTTLVDKALASDLDIVEFWVSQAGSTLYATGKDNSASLVPTLADILNYGPLRDSDHPIRLRLTQAFPSADEFARAVLSLLLAKRTHAAGGYARDCRPVHLMAFTDKSSQDAVLATEALLASDSKYAALRGHIHFGGYVAWDEAASAARDHIDKFATDGLEFVDIESSERNLVGLARYARGKGLHTFARETLEIGLEVPLCGIVDGLATPQFAYGGGTGFRHAITSSRTLVELDVHDLATDADEVSYSVQPAGTSEQRALGAATPSLASGAVGAPLPGTFLSFAAASSQSLALNNPQLPTSYNKLAILAVLRPNTGPLPSGGRAVIVSKRQGESGWALELVDAGGGTKDLHFEAFVRNKDSSVHKIEQSMSADVFDQSTGQHVLADVDWGAKMRVSDNYKEPLPDGIDFSLDYGYSVIENDAPITLGSEAGASTDYFDGDLQVFKMVSFSY